MNAEQKRKNMRKERKKEIKRLYKRTMWFVRELIDNEKLDRHCSIDLDTERHFIGWLVQKKLEREGYECALVKSSICCVLNVWW